MAGRPKGSENKDKPFKTALLMEAKLAEDGEATPAHKGSLRWVARQLLERAGDETQAAKEIGDRFDGKVPQAVIGDENEPPVMISAIVRKIVHADNPDG